MISANPVLDLISAQQPSIYYIDQGVGLFASLGSPEGAIACNRGSVACDVLSGDVYRKTTNLVNTGWVLASGGGGTVTGSGTSGKLPKWTGATALGDSLLTESANLITDAGALFVQAVSTSIIPMRVQAPVGLAVEGFNYLDSGGNRRVVISASGTFAFAGFNSAITVSSAGDVKMYFDKNGGGVDGEWQFSKDGGAFLSVVGVMSGQSSQYCLPRWEDYAELRNSLFFSEDIAGEARVAGLLKVNFTSPAQGQVHIVPASTGTRGVYVNAPSGATADLLKLDTNGVLRMSVAPGGDVTHVDAAKIQWADNTCFIQGDRGNGRFFVGAGSWIIASATGRVNFGSTSIGDTGLERKAPAVVGFADGGASIGGTYSSIARTPAQITADQNNYNPGGVSRFQRWSSDAARNVTGLTFSTTQVDGQSHLIVNIGAQNIVLKHQDAASAAANRFLNSTGADITLSAEQAAEIVYDNTTARWRVYKLN